MKRSTAEKLLVEYVKGELPDEEARQVTAMLEDDGELRRSAAAYRQVVDAERTLRALMPQPASVLPDEIMKKVSLVERGLSLNGRYGYAGERSSLDQPLNWLSELLARHQVSLTAAFCAVVILSLTLNLYSLRISSTRLSLSAPSLQEEVQVLVPAHDISAGQALRPDMFHVVTLPRAVAPPTSFIQPPDLEGRFARVGLKSGEPLYGDVISRVVPLNIARGQIPPGMRAVTIRIDSGALPSLEDWAFPGNRADVVWTSSIQGYLGSSLIALDAQILSAERDFTSGESQGLAPTLVSLALDEETATKIQLAQATGNLSLQLRGINAKREANQAEFGQKVVTIDTLLNGQECQSHIVFQSKLYCVRPNGALKAVE